MNDAWVLQPLSLCRAFRRTAPFRGAARTALAILWVAAFAACGTVVEEPPVAGAGSGELSVPTTWAFENDTTPVTGMEGMVVSTDAYASQVGLDVLQDGGNAVDAAIATGFALAVVNPEAGNLGGGGFMIVRNDEGGVFALDHREKAPLAATRDMFLDEEGNVTEASTVGHLSAGVPGTVAGLWEAYRRFGSLTWSRLLQPAIDLAAGFEVRERQVATLVAAQNGIRQFESGATIFLPGGRVPQVGDTLRQYDLTETLIRIQTLGAADFYEGETADLLVAEMERGGGIITKEDLASYEAVWRDPTEFDYRGYTVYSMPPPSSGGVTMAEITNIVEEWDLRTYPWHSPQSIHLMAEAFRRAYADRNEYLADPDFIEMPLGELVSQEYAAHRAQTISMDRATPSSEVNPGVAEFTDETHTTHYSVVDRDGNAVSVTTSINSWYGSKVVVEGAGFFLNNTMDDFAAKPGTPNQFGLVQGENNAVEPSKRMLSAMTPTIVTDPQGELFLVAGTPGGSTIITTVFQTISNIIDYGMNVVEAVHAPRVHHQHLPDQIYYEYGGLTSETVMALEALGHTVVERDPGPPDAYFTGGMSGDVQAIMRTPGGVLEGWSDPRRGGRAVAY
ncbi:MAG: gamma-glutamyltransferase [Gemmatimonadetes bacterium]|nr:gamma-glutamyltransferase [Gemmatimonadota bacterium]